MPEQNHWDAVYRTKAPDQVSWFSPHLERSIAFIEGASLPREAAILDVGGGASTLVDDLLDRGYTQVSVLDLSAAAIACAQERLGPRAGLVTWRVADITTADLPDHSVDVWHDRAVFHFLREAEDRARYVAMVRRVLKPRGHIVVATFGPDGPERCSGLEVVRFGADALHGQFGGSFQKVASATEAHTTPWGSVQQFVYCYCRIA